ncbi:MAG: winged helix-turn-helix domain-containing protein [Sphingomonas sp.]|nr:winged helix-turn-helix domain-containing protein [Sphingomonas sp.]
MQVLVVLGRARGSIVTRDELIERCWDSRVVGEDAINRVISRLRHVAEQFRGSYRVETITKVGYRLVVANEAERSATASPSAADPPLATRRSALAAGAAAVVAVGGVLAWKAPWRHQPLAEAVELFHRGDIAQRAGFPDQARQSVSYFERAVHIDPLYAEAWGALALAYTHILEGFDIAELASLPGRIRAAAARAMELDPDNADAQLALACIPPFFRNWDTAERELRLVRDRHPRHWLANGRLAMLLYQVGRFEEGAALHQGVIAFDPMIVGPYAFAATALSNAGQMQAAEALLRRALDRWPAHPLLWFGKFNHLLFSGRPGAAAAFIQDPDALPSSSAPDQVQSRLVLARSVEFRRPADIDSSVARLHQIAEADPRAIPGAAPIFALLGRLDLTFACLDRYYFDRGPFGAPAPIGSYTRRHTDFLFSLPMAAARPDPRFARLTRAIGLDDYWRATGSRPAQVPA